MKNKTALITGAAMRIGAAITEELHHMGMDVIIHFNSSEEPARKLAGKLNQLRPDSAHLLQADLEDTSSCSRLIDTAIAINNRMDVLINNASAFYPTPVNSVNEEQWENLINVNLKAPLFLSQFAAPCLSQNNGSIINLADIHAERPLKNHLLYSVSKAGLIMLTKSLALELAPEVRVNAISPGAIFWHEDMNDEEKEEILRKVPLKRMGKAEEISRAVRYLIEDANYTTGEILVIDGGRNLVA